MTVLIGYDGSPESIAALDEAAAAARAHDARLHVVTCLEHEAGDSPTRTRRELEDADEADAQLREIVAELSSEGIEATSELRHGLTGSAAQVLLDEAETVGAQLIVLGFDPKARMTEMMLGSVAREVLRAAHCPVMTVKAPVDG